MCLARRVYYKLDYTISQLLYKIRLSSHDLALHHHLAHARGIRHRLKRWMRFRVESDILNIALGIYSHLRVELSRYQWTPGVANVLTYAPLLPTWSQ